ncbi:MAG: hypothetical protein KIS68_02010, partial [Bauldia sp.]|nr:hypothetical protein [Bauldia sp.]
MAIGARQDRPGTGSGHSVFRLGSAAALGPLLLILAACNGGGGGGGGGGGTASCEPKTGNTAIAMAYDVTFNPTLADQYLEDDEFNFANADWANCPASQSNPYALVNLHLARSAGLDGT